MHTLIHACTHIYIHEPTTQQTPNNHPHPHDSQHTHTHTQNKALEFRAQQEKALGHTPDGCKHAQAKKLGAFFFGGGGALFLRGGGL